MLKQCQLVLGLTIVGLIGCGPANPPSHNEKPIASGEIGSQLPDFAVNDFEGQEITSAALAGKVALIDFWATWCEPCKKEMPGYQKLVDLYGSRGFAVLGLKFDTMADTEDPMQFAKRIRVYYPLALATDDLKQKFGGIDGLPTTMLYNRRGTLRKKIIGFEYTDVVEV